MQNEKQSPDYREINNQLSKLQDTGSKAQFYVDLIELINQIADYVIPEDNPSRERISDVMGGQILELRSEKLREEGRTLELYSMVQDRDTSPERAARRLGITISILKSRMIASGYQYPEV